MSAFADDLAAKILSDVAIPLEPPVDIELLAHRLGVVEIAEADIVEDGRLRTHGRGYAIDVRRHNVSSQRRRFTIAHELGHLILGVEGNAGIARRQLHTDEERLCDEIAAAILIPADWLRTRFASRRHDLSTLRHLAHLTDTSLAAGLVRCKEVLGWPEALVRWAHDAGKWRYRGGAGIPVSIHTYVHSAAATSDAIDRIRHRGRRDQEASIPVDIRGRIVELHGQFSVARNHAVAIVRFPRS